MSVTKKGKEFLESPYALMLTEDRKFVDGEDDDDDAFGIARGSGVGDEILLKMLKDLRKDVARRLKLQPWVIFSDASLADMTIMYPVTIDELSQWCQGVGKGKAEKFGREFVDLIAKYVKENEIERPDDFIVLKSAGSKSDKAYIIQSIDRRLSLDDIAEAKDMEMSELLDEIEALVSSGTKLNLNYYIEQTLDEYVVEEIFDYFKEEAQSDSLEEALNELGSDYEELEVRLVRIKFLCDVAN